MHVASRDAWDGVLRNIRRHSICPVHCEQNKFIFVLYINDINIEVNIKNYKNYYLKNSCIKTLINIGSRWPRE
jgi:hypothetical protein